MPVHDWTRVEAGVFHAFHTAWIGQLQAGLNKGLLPEGYYALAEQHAGKSIADVVTLHTAEAGPSPGQSAGAGGGLAVAERPPRTQRKQTIAAAALSHQRTLAIRHVSGHRLVALCEIVSPANKDRGKHVADFVDKLIAALDVGVHVLLLDLFPPGPHDPQGLHGEILKVLDPQADTYDLPGVEPLTLASYVAPEPIDVYLNHLAVGRLLPEMPLFLQTERYVPVPLEATYAAAYQGFPQYWRQVVEG